MVKAKMGQTRGRQWVGQRMLSTLLLFGLVHAALGRRFDVVSSLIEQVLCLLSRFSLIY